MNVLILGGDGYLGWATAMYLSARGHEVAVVDNYLRRSLCRELEAEPLIAVPDLDERCRLWHAASGRKVSVYIGDVSDYRFLSDVFREFSPHAVVHYAEQASAPYSMMSQEGAALTVRNNLMSTLNVAFAARECATDCHIVKLGTMGEYGTPNIDIEEGYLDVEHKGRKERFLYPKTPGSIYHLSKAQDSDLLFFAARMWGLAITDMNQGPVYGIETDELSADQRLAPIFNYDGIFGTVLNRFVVQAVAGFPLTVYGKGGQTRGYLNIRDTLQCVGLALAHPANAGEFRVFNQFTETFSVNELAERVAQAASTLGLKTTIRNIENPRKEAEEHYYNPMHTGLLELGLKPHLLTEDVIGGMLRYVQRHNAGIQEVHILPQVRWT